MTFHAQVHNQVLMYEARRGVRPTYLYLGEAEYAALLELEKELRFIRVPAPKGKGREFLGMGVFRVDSDSHLGVA